MEKAALLYTKGSSLREAAKTVGVSHTGLWKWLTRNKVDKRPPGRASPLTRDVARTIVRRHQKEHKSLRSIAQEFNVDRETVKRAILNSGYMVFSAKQMRRLMRDGRDIEMRPVVHGLYKDGLSIREISKHLHTDSRRVRRLVIELLNGGSIRGKNKDQAV